MPTTTDKVAWGEQQARARAAQAYNAAGVIFKNYRGIFAQVIGGAPLGLAVGHLMRVNPKALTQPPLTTDKRVGFMYVSGGECKDALVDWSRIANPPPEEVLLNSYVWGYALNNAAKELHLDTKDVFTTPNETFWRLAYIYATLGETAYDVIWQARDKSDTDYYKAFMRSADAMNKAVAGWSVIRINKVLLNDCPYVFHVAKQFGKLETKVFGQLPVLKSYTTLPTTQKG